MGQSFVIDNSVVMSWCFKDEASEYADAVLDSLQESSALVPSIWPLEVVNVLLVAERKRRLSKADSVRFITLLSKLPIIVEYERTETMMNELLTLARVNNLSSYDTAYLDLSLRKGLPISTTDTRLIKAAKNADVTIFMG
ncbi:MAG: type II toxin-antitoxin system VapC family toxin [Deltaproteobacteria bacterium]|nr:type II toxin-antitoxin system VapC family toxin [Deltaproteobacteria bacterium]